MELLNPYVQCPYNRAHEVPLLRLQHHLVKCRKNYAGGPKKTCPFNATHIVNAPEFAMHVKECMDSKFIEGSKYNVLRAEHGDLANTPFHHDIPVDERWDVEETDDSHRTAQGCSEEAPLCSVSRRNFDVQNLQPLRRPAGPLSIQSKAIIKTRNMNSCDGSSQDEAVNEEKNVNTCGDHSQMKTTQEININRNGAMGMGRGRIHAILAEMRKQNCGV